MRASDGVDGRRRHPRARGIDRARHAPARRRTHRGGRAGRSRGRAAHAGRARGARAAGPAAARTASPGRPRPRGRARAVPRGHSHRRGAARPPRLATAFWARCDERHTQRRHGRRKPGPAATQSSCGGLAAAGGRRHRPRLRRPDPRAAGGRARPHPRRWPTASRRRATRSTTAPSAGVWPSSSSSRSSSSRPGWVRRSSRRSAPTSRSCSTSPTWARRSCSARSAIARCGRAS